MNINDLTIGQAKELHELFGSGNFEVKNLIIPATHSMVGKYVIARCYSAGVHAGEVVSVDGETAILKNSRRLWSWKASDGIALSGVAQKGLKPGSSKLDEVNPEIYITGVCELIPVANGIRENIHGYK